MFTTITDHVIINSNNSSLIKELEAYFLKEPRFNYKDTRDEVAALVDNFLNEDPPKYDIVCDERNNTPEVINEGKIKIDILHNEYFGRLLKEKLRK